MYYDFKIRPLLYDQSAAMIYMYDVYPENRTPWNILVKVTGDHGEAYERIAEAYSRIRPDGAFDAAYIEDEIAATFEEYTRLQKIIIIFTVIAVFVSSLGLFAMSTYYIRARSRNIAVQKVFGADKRLVLRQIVISYLSPLLRSGLPHSPVPEYRGHQYQPGHRPAQGRLIAFKDGEVQFNGRLGVTGRNRLENAELR